MNISSIERNQSLIGFFSGDIMIIEKAAGLPKCIEINSRDVLDPLYVGVYVGIIMLVEFAHSGVPFLLLFPLSLYLLPLLYKKIKSSSIFLHLNYFETGP